MYRYAWRGATLCGMENSFSEINSRIWSLYFSWLNIGFAVLVLKLLILLQVHDRLASIIVMESENSSLNGRWCWLDPWNCERESENHSSAGDGLEKISDPAERPRERLISDRLQRCHHWRTFKTRWSENVPLWVDRPKHHPGMNLYIREFVLFKL